MPVEQILPTTEALTWQPWFDQLESCADLANGWNGYTAPAPNERAITTGRDFLSALKLAGVQPTRVGPSAMGGIAITRKVGHRKVLIECYNDGRIFALFADRQTEDMPVEQIENNPLAFSVFIVKMQGYLDG